MTLRGLAEKVGVTGSLVSQIENGQANPSVDTLYGLADALGVPATCFFETAEQHAAHGETVAPAAHSPVVRTADRRCLELANGVTWQSLLPNEEPGFEFCEVRYPPGSFSAQAMEQHSGRHSLVVTEGKLTVQLAFQSHRLAAGDSITFDASMPHQLRNEDPEPVRAILTLRQRQGAELAPQPGPNPP